MRGVDPAEPLHRLDDLFAEMVKTSLVRRSRVNPDRVSHTPEAVPGTKEIADFDKNRSHRGIETLLVGEGVENLWAL